MVDREARNRMAELLRHFTAGRITNRELDWNLPHSKTDATACQVARILEYNFEGLFEKPSYIEHDGPVTREERRELARIAMYLYTDLEYPELPARTFLGKCIDVVVGTLCFFTWPLIFMFLELRDLLPWHAISQIQEVHGDDIWPFTNREEYEDALKHPKLLCGKQRSY